MQTIAHQIYPERFRQLETIVSAIQNNDLGLANRLLSERFQGLTFISTASERLQTELFLEALRTRLDVSAQVSNLYLMPDQGRQIQMFNFMAEKFPVVSRAQGIVNTLLMEAAAGEERLALLDIGMGTGQQAENLFTQMLARKMPVREVLLIGIEPSSESLGIARERFRKLAEAKGIAITFAALQKTAEQLGAEDWDDLRQRIADFGGKLLLNASFALHHIQPVSIRTEFFRRLKAFDPAVFALIEPYGDYTTDNVVERFHNAWHHYGLTFKAIDTIEASDEDKSEVKRVFFGRELPDVMAARNRIEQYETGEMWLDRLAEAGFKPIDLTLPADLTNDFNSLIRINPQPGYLGFNVNGYPIVAVMGAR